MILRRAFYWWQFPAAIVLPLWLLVGWGFFGSGGWSFLGLLVAAPLLLLAMLAIGGIIYARKDVRESKAVSWTDVGLLAAWQASIIAFGFYGPGAGGIAVVGVLIGLAVFWLTLRELLAETRRRVKSTLDAYQQAAQPREVRHPGGGADDRVIVVEERRD
ncbi:MAG: hypothetical protein QOF36_2654 [Microbacteriaceae bacterium]|jgi:hypothetical protein|nr:hypothetical protein [Microbacteriaceae bacterium]